MKKILPYILIVIIALQLFAPFTIGSGIKNNLEIKSNKAEAADDSIKVIASVGATDTTITVTVRAIWGNNGWRTTDPGVTVTLLDSSNPAKVLNSVLLTGSSSPVKLTDVAEDQWTSSEKNISPKPDTIQEATVTFPGLRPATTYGITTIGLHGVTSWWSILTSGASAGIPAIPDISITTIASPNPFKVTTNSAGNTTFIPTGEQVAVNEDAILPTCEWASSDTWGGCVGRLIYWAIFKPTSYIFALTGRLLDVSVDYSVKDTSYRSPFVVEGWGVVRDFCNMFFIFILLYIAFGTILNLHSVKTKEMIINVVIIGLLINFSLFATQVIIDASNILTRVFYNSESITVGPKVDGVIQDQRGSQGEIKLSEALVSKINPQKLILQAEKAENIQTNQLVGQIKKENNGISATTFILVTILASIVNIVGIITFLFSALIFISRVIGLWLAMIFAPLAFFSYTVPALQDVEMVGWKKWWPDTLKMAFLAPVFVFFIYLIIKFLNTGLGLVINENKGGLDFILGIFVPFIFIMLLLIKAKDIAKNMSGKIGESITNAVKTVGGVGLAAVTGGAAMAMRGTIANSDSLKAAEAKGGLRGFGAKTLRNIGGSAGKGSMDLRGVKIAGKGLDSTGLKVGKAEEGGFAKMRADKIIERQKRARELEVGEDSTLKQNINKKQNALDAAKSDVGKQTDITKATKEIVTIEKNIAIADRDVVKAERDLKDAIDKYGARSSQADTARTARTGAVKVRDDLITDPTSGLDAAKDRLKTAEVDIKTAESELKTAQNAVVGANRQRRVDYAKKIQGGWSNSINMIVSGGQHSVQGEREAANKILAGIKEEKK